MRWYCLLRWCLECVLGDSQEGRYSSLTLSPHFYRNLRSLNWLPSTSASISICRKFVDRSIPTISVYLNMHAFHLTAYATSTTPLIIFLSICMGNATYSISFYMYTLHFINTLLLFIYFCDEHTTCISLGMHELWNTTYIVQILYNDQIQYFNIWFALLLSHHVHTTSHTSSHLRPIASNLDDHISLSGINLILHKRRV